MSRKDDKKSEPEKSPLVRGGGLWGTVDKTITEKKRREQLEDASNAKPVPDPKPRR